MWVNAGDIERRVRRSHGAKNRNTHTEGKRRGRRDVETGRWTDGILRQSFLEIVQRNRVEVDAVASSHHKLPARDHRHARRPRKRNARAKILLGGVIEVTAWQLADGNQSECRIEGGKASTRFLNGSEEVVAQPGDKGQFAGYFVIVHRKTAHDVLIDIGPAAAHPRNARRRGPRRRKSR